MIYWNDIDEVKPEKGSHIWYISKKMAELQYKENIWSHADVGDVEFGDYVKDNLVEWSYDMDPEEFKYWIYFPMFK